MKFQPILGDKLSGKLGGIVASHNTYGSYFRKLVRPVNKKTTAQQAQRSAIAAISSSWRNLDPTVQATWIAAAIVKTSRKGDRVNLSGQAAYMYVNVLRFRLGLSIIGSPPAGTGLAPVLTPPTLSLTASDSVDITFGATDTWNATDGGVILSGALLTSRGKSFASPALAIAGIADPGSGPVTVPLPLAIPIGGRLRIDFHATAPDGSQTTYVSADVANPSFPVPPSIVPHVLSVTHVGGHTYLWRFSGLLGAITSGPDANLIVEADTALTESTIGVNDLLVVYTSANADNAAWSIPAQPTSIANPIIIPQSGTCS
jgi:hypothetical protein